MAQSIKQKAIKHYDKMIEWAEKQNGKVYGTLMRNEIKTAWGSMDCSYCAEYNALFYGCNVDCPLYSDGGCCGGTWRKMSTSIKWETWVKYAKRVRQYIIYNG